MNKSILIIAAVVVLCVSQSLSAEINEQEKNAQSFAWKKISLGSTLSEIKESHPKIIDNDEWISAAEKKQGVGGLVLQGEAGIDMGLLRTYEEKVFFVIIVYDYDDVKALSGGDLEAGLKIFLTKLKDKIGDDYEYSEGEDTGQFLWELKKVNRKIALEFDDKDRYIRLLYKDTAVAKQIIEKAKETADVGF
jgi:hypothetical protein